MPTDACLPWQVPIWQRLSTRIANDQLGHAALLYGQRGIGKFELAKRLLGALICDGLQKGDPDCGVSACGQCRGCHLLMAGNHPNAWVIQPEEGAAGIGIDRIRDLIRQVSLTTQVGLTKAVVIAPAEAMNRPAANALLKTLEEPPGRSFFILVSHTPSALPRTIRSRCQAMAVPTPDEKSAAQWLHQVAPAAVELLVAAENAPFEAIRLAEGGAGAILSDLHEGLEKLLSGHHEPLAVMTAMRRVSDAGLIVTTMQRFTQQLVRLKFGLDVPFTNETHEVLTRHLDGLEFEQLYALSDRINRAQNDLRSSTSFNEQIMLEDLAVEWVRLQPFHTG